MVHNLSYLFPTCLFLNLKLLLSMFPCMIEMTYLLLTFIAWHCYLSYQGCLGLLWLHLQSSPGLSCWEYKAYQLVTFSHLGLSSCLLHLSQTLASFYWKCACWEIQLTMFIYPAEKTSFVINLLYLLWFLLLCYSSMYILYLPMYFIL